MSKRIRKLFGILILVAVAAGGLTVVYRYMERQSYRIEYEEYVERYAERYDLPPSLLYAVIHTESRFSPDAVSSVGATGLMQIMPDTFDWIFYRKGETRDITYESMKDPELNIEYGSFMLAVLLEDFKTVENALAAYHAGYGRVSQWLADSEYSEDGETLTNIPYADTQNYVNKVLRAQKQYQSLYDME